MAELTCPPHPLRPLRQPERAPIAIAYEPVPVAKPAPVAKVKKEKKQSVLLYSWPPLFYAWPLILVGYGLWIASAFGSFPLAAWEIQLWNTVLIIVFLTIGVALSQLHTTLVCVALVLAWFDVPPFSFVLPQTGIIDGTEVLKISNGLLLANLAVFVFLWRTRYQVVGGAFVERHINMFGVSTTRHSTPSVGKQVREEFPSFLKILLGFGAGDLHIYDSNGVRELYDIRDIPFLYYQIDEIRNKLGSNQVAEEENAT